MEIITMMLTGGVFLISLLTFVVVLIKEMKK